MGEDIGVTPDTQENGDLSHPRIGVVFNREVAINQIQRARSEVVLGVIRSNEVPGITIDSALHKDNESLVLSFTFDFPDSNLKYERLLADRFIKIFEKIAATDTNLKLQYNSLKGISGIDELRAYNSSEISGPTLHCHAYLSDESPESLQAALESVAMLAEYAFQDKELEIPTDSTLKLNKPKSKPEIKSRESIFGENDLMGHVDMEYYRIDPNTIWERLDDIIGQPEAKEYAVTLLRLMEYPDLMRAMGMEVNRFVLFNGDPGLGKTMMARAICGETKGKTEMYYVDIASLNKGAGLMGGLERTVGSVLNGTIQQAEADPEKFHILFIDEIDGVFGTSLYGTHHATEGAIRVLQQTIEGFNNLPRNFVLIGSTNYPDKFPHALRSRTTEVNFYMPDNEARQELIDKYNERQGRGVLNFYDESGKLTNEAQTALEGMSHREIMKSIKDLLNIRILQMIHTAEEHGMDLSEIDNILRNTESSEVNTVLKDKQLIVELDTAFLVKYLPQTSAYRQKMERQNKNGKNKREIGFNINNNKF